MRMITRAFEVRAKKKALIYDLARDLDRKLCDLQKVGWNIISVNATSCQEYEYPGYYDSTLYTIIASAEVEEDE